MIPSDDPSVLREEPVAYNASRSEAMEALRQLTAKGPHEVWPRVEVAPESLPVLERLCEQARLRNIHR